MSRRTREFNGLLETEKSDDQEREMQIKKVDNQDEKFNHQVSIKKTVKK